MARLLYYLPKITWHFMKMENNTMEPIKLTMKDVRYINNLFGEQILKAQNGKAVFTSEQAQEKFLNEVRKSTYYHGQEE